MVDNEQEVYKVHWTTSHTHTLQTDEIIINQGSNTVRKKNIGWGKKETGWTSNG